METCYKLWSGLFNRPVFYENKDKYQAEQTFKNYKECCNGSGAILFAVHRGKYSEGFNFKNELCRAIILIGVPHLNLKSSKILLK